MPRSRTCCGQLQHAVASNTFRLVQTHEMLTCRLSKMSGRAVSMWLLYLEAFLTGAVLLCSTSEVRNSRATLVGMAVSDSVRASVRISTICMVQTVATFRHI